MNVLVLAGRVIGTAVAEEFPYRRTVAQR